MRDIFLSLQKTSAMRVLGKASICLGVCPLGDGGSGSHHACGAMFMCHFWHNFDGPFYSNSGTYGTLPLLVYIYLPFLAHLCTNYPIGTRAPIQPNMAW